MRNMGSSTESCPFEFNFDPATFKAGDPVSYRVDSLGDMPFVGTIVEVFADYVTISGNDPREPDRIMLGTRESRPQVSDAQAFD